MVTTKTTTGNMYAQSFKKVFWSLVHHPLTFQFQAKPEEPELIENI